MSLSFKRRTCRSGESKSSTRTSGSKYRTITGYGKTGCWRFYRGMVIFPRAGRPGPRQVIGGVRVMPWRQQEKRPLAEDGEDRGSKKTTLEEREKRLERLREAMRERGEDVAKLVRTWINEKEDQ